MNILCTRHFRGENPFNILATLIAKLPALDKTLYESQDNRDSFVDSCDWDHMVFSLLTSINDFTNVGKLLRDGLSKQALEQLEIWQNDHPGFSPTLSLICGLDSILSWNDIIKSSYLTTVLHDGFESLNDNANETDILILPRVPSLNDPLDRSQMTSNCLKKTWAHTWEPGINEELTNTYYIDKKSLNIREQPYKVVHRIAQNWLHKDKILLAVSPVSKHAKLKEPTYYECKEGRRFSVVGTENPDLIHRRIRAAYFKACEVGASLLVYPEMLGDKDMLAISKNSEEESAFVDFFSHLGELAEEAEYSSPELILSPTWWKDQRNELYVIDGTGKLVCTQDKQNPFLYDPDPVPGVYLEDLKKSTPIIQVVHIPYIGRLTFPICKDYLVVPYRELLARILRSTILICPSYSKGKFSFHISAPAELEYGCYTLWINTCAALPESDCPPQYIGLFAAPTSDPTFHFEPKCQGQCGSEDDPCLFLVEIHRTGTVPEIQLPEHICSATLQH